MFPPPDALGRKKCEELVDCGTGDLARPRRGDAVFPGHVAELAFAAVQAELDGNDVKIAV